MSGWCVCVAQVVHVCMYPVAGFKFVLIVQVYIVQVYRYRNLWLKLKTVLALALTCILHLASCIHDMSSCSYSYTLDPPFNNVNAGMTPSPNITRGRSLHVCAPPKHNGRVSDNLALGDRRICSFGRFRGKGCGG